MEPSKIYNIILIRLIGNSLLIYSNFSSSPLPQSVNGERMVKLIQQLRIFWDSDVEEMSSKYII